MRLFRLGLCALVGTEAVRSRRKESPQTTKFIEGVPVLNYHLAYGGQSLSEEEKLQVTDHKWVIVVKSKLQEAVLKKLCGLIKCTGQGNPEKGGVPFIEVEGCEGTLKKFLISEAVKKVVKFIEPDVEAEAIPEMDEAEGGSASWGLDRIGASKRANEGNGVHIFVLDTGIRASHGDFGGRVVPTLDMSKGFRGTFCEPGQEDCTNDAQGHGTHCAGTAAGASFGVAPAATIHAVKVLGDSGRGSFTWSYTALDYMATDGEKPSVASMSLGGPGVLGGMATAIDAATSAGVVVVVAGGNSNSDACGFSPAYVPSAITVGSSTSTDERSGFSNYGPCTDIWAPGSAITSAGHKSDDMSATYSGTSMACPHVSGASALVLENNPTMKSDEVLETLLGVAVDGVLTDLKDGDTNRLLYVGDDAVPAPPLPPRPTPTPAPPKCGLLCSKLTCFMSGCKGCDYCGAALSEKSGKGGKKGKGGKRGKGGKKGKGGKRGKGGKKSDC